MVGLRFSSRLAQGPAVRVADRHHSLRLDMLTKTRSTFLQVRCALVALWSEHEAAYATWIRPATTKLDSFLPTSSAQLRQFRPGTLPGTDGPSGSTNSRSVGVIRPLNPAPVGDRPVVSLRDEVSASPTANHGLSCVRADHVPSEGAL